MVRLNFNPVSPARGFRASATQQHRPDRPPPQQLLLDPFQDHPEPTTSTRNNPRPPIASDTIASTSSTTQSHQRSFLYSKSNTSVSSSHPSSSAHRYSQRDLTRTDTSRSDSRTAAARLYNHTDNSDNDQGGAAAEYRLRRPGRASSRVDRAPNPNENEQEEDEDQVEEGEEQDQETEDEEDEEFEEESPWTLPLVLGKDNPLKHLTQAQRDLALDTLEIETMDRVQKLRASLDVLTTSLKFRTEAEIKRLPAEVRAMSVEEFWFKYNGSAKEYLRRQKENKIDPNMMLVQGISDIKRKRDNSGQDEHWQSTKRNKEERETASSRKADLNTNRPFQQSTRYKPYPTPDSQTLPSSSTSSSKTTVDSKINQR